MFRRVSVPCVRWSRLCSAGSPCPAFVLTMFRRVSVPCVRWSRLCSAGPVPCVRWSRLCCRVSVCVGLDYVPQGLRALHALVSTMFRRMASAFVPCVRWSRLCSAGSPCPACVLTMFRRVSVPCVRSGSDGHEGLRSHPSEQRLDA